MENTAATFVHDQSPGTDKNIQPATQLPKVSFPIITVGASAGGMDALKKLVARLPKDFQASLFIVWHMSPDVRGILPQILNRADKLYAAHAYDGEPIMINRIYVAPPDRHLLIEKGRVRVTKGPKENRFRPAVDPLFRSAAYNYGPDVIGVILSGALDDGTSGLWTVKHHGGIAIVQDPLDAEVSSMPANALREVAVDFSVPVTDIAGLLVRLVKERIAKPEEQPMEDDEKTKIEMRIAAEENALEAGVMKLGELTPFTCPECNGVLSMIKEGSLKRCRCHTGHAFSPDSLLAALTEAIEENLWSAVRGVEESMMLLNHIGDHFAEMNQTKLAAQFFKKAKEAQRRSEMVRQVALQHEELSRDIVEEGAEEERSENNNK